MPIRHIGGCVATLRMSARRPGESASPEAALLSQGRISWSVGNRIRSGLSPRQFLSFACGGSWPVLLTDTLRLRKFQPASAF